MGCTNIQFISNNVQVIKNSDKRIDIFEYLKNKVNSRGVLFLQKTNSYEKDEKSWITALNSSYGTKNFSELL